MHRLDHGLIHLLTLIRSDYKQTGALSNGMNLFVQSFEGYGHHDRRYRVDPPTQYGSNIDKMVHAVEVPAGLIDGPLVVLWLVGILHDKWYRYPAQLVVSALHAFGTIVFWADEFFYGYLNWRAHGQFVSPNTNGPRDFGFWWAFIGTNLVWVIVPILCMKNALTHMKPLLQAKHE